MVQNRKTPLEKCWENCYAYLGAYICYLSPFAGCEMLRVIQYKVKNLKISNREPQLIRPNCDLFFYWFEMISHIEIIML